MMPRLAYRDHQRHAHTRADPHGGYIHDIADADGLASLSFSYQWQADNG